LARAFDELPAGQKVAISDFFTRLRKCFGWICVPGRDFVVLNDSIEIDDYAAKKGETTASYIEPDQLEYFAIMYEYIPDTKLELDAVQRQLDFFHHIGFHPCQDADKRNWQGPGILLDFGDYTSPVDRWFGARSAWRPCLSAEAIVDWDQFEEKIDRELNRLKELRERGIDEEEKREQQKKFAQEDTTEAMEWGYEASRWHRSYFDRKSKTQHLWTSYSLTPGTVSAEEIREQGLEPDPLAHIKIPDIEPRALIMAWRAYNRDKKDYLAQVDKAKNGLSEG
jgi:hypothetical protein